MTDRNTSDVTCGQVASALLSHNVSCFMTLLLPYAIILSGE